MADVNAPSPFATTSSPVDAVSAVVLDYGNVLYAWEPMAAVAGYVSADEWEEFVVDGGFLTWNERLDRGEPFEQVLADYTRAHPGRVIISTSGQIVDQPGSPLQAPVDSPIMTLIDGVTGSGVPTAVVAPRLYLENLLLPVVLGPVREEGVLRYPLPASFPVSWSSHLDVAEVVACLLTDASPTTGTVGVGHLPGLTGPDLAAAFSSRLGREVRFESITPEAFGELITPFFGPAAAPVVNLYRALNAQDGNTIAEDSSAQEILRLQPRSIGRWLEDLAVS